MMRDHWLYILLLMPLLALLNGCRDDDGPEAIIPALADIATFEGNNEQGALFTLRQVDDSPLVTLQSSTPIEKVSPGQRMRIVYVPLRGAGAYESADILLRQAKSVWSGEAQTGGRSAYGAWDEDGIYPYAVWRSGEYINLDLLFPVVAKVEGLGIVFDELTVDSEMPVGYVVMKLSQRDESFQRRGYASFDISGILNRPNCRGVKLRINNMNLTDQREFIFPKN